MGRKHSGDSNEGLFTALIEEANRLSSRIERPSSACATVEGARDVFDVTYRARRIRDVAFCEPDLFGEAAWDILLALARAAQSGPCPTVSDLCRESCIAPTAAVRYIFEMESRGLIERRKNCCENRPRCLALSSKARAALHRYSEALAGLKIDAEPATISEIS